MDVNKIPLSVLEAIRQRMDAEDENDTSKDKLIEQLTPLELVGKLSGWELGDESWGRKYVNIYNELVKSSGGD